MLFRSARGLRQRVDALNRFLHDIYHEQKILRAGVIHAEQVNASLDRIVGQNDAAAKRLSGELFVRLTHADIEEIFQSGLHEYLTDCQDDINALGTRMQRAYLGTV